jgi:hypothetical protein
MKSLRGLLTDSKKSIPNTIATFIDQNLNAHWEEEVSKNNQFNVDAYKRMGEPAYGMFVIKLLKPVFAEIELEGFALESDYLASSVELWGPPEERERCMWFFIKKDGVRLGSIVIRIIHDHTQFRLPYVPKVMGLSETTDQKVREALSYASHRKAKINEFIEDSSNQEEGTWEYSAEIGFGDYLRSSGGPDTSEALLDNQLAIWGRHNWELTTVAPYEGRLVAFFKRPKK